MAKLQNVETNDMVNGEITAIKYDGAVYAKADGLNAAEVGDILLPHEQSIDVTKGAFYRITSISDSRMSFIDDESGNSFSKRHSKLSLFRKASESPQASADCVSRVAAVEQRMDAVEAKLAPETLVKGDRVLISGSSIAGADTDGKFGRYERVSDVAGLLVTVEGTGRLFNRNQLTKVAGTEALKVGDYIVIVPNGYLLQTYKVGEILPIIGFRGNGFPIVQADRRKSEFMNTAQIRKATDAEVEAATAAAQATKDSVFTKAGRKPNEYRKGDVVQFTDDYTAIGIVEDGNRGNDNLIGVRTEREKCSYQTPRIRDVEIVCFAENRADAKGVA